MKIILDTTTSVRASNDSFRRLVQVQSYVHAFSVKNKYPPTDCEASSPAPAPATLDPVPAQDEEVGILATSLHYRLAALPRKQTLSYREWSHETEQLRSALAPWPHLVSPLEYSNYLSGYASYFWGFPHRRTSWFCEWGSRGAVSRSRTRTLAASRTRHGRRTGCPRAHHRQSMRTRAAYSPHCKRAAQETAGDRAAESVAQVAASTFYDACKDVPWLDVLSLSTSVTALTCSLMNAVQHPSRLSRATAAASLASSLCTIANAVKSNWPALAIPDDIIKVIPRVVFPDAESAGPSRPPPAPTTIAARLAADNLSDFSALSAPGKEASSAIEAELGPVSTGCDVNSVAAEVHARIGRGDATIVYCQGAAQFYPGAAPISAYHVGCPHPSRSLYHEYSTTLFGHFPQCVAEPIVYASSVKPPVPLHATKMATTLAAFENSCVMAGTCDHWEYQNMITQYSAYLNSHHHYETMPAVAAFESLKTALVDMKLTGHKQYKENLATQESLSTNNILSTGIAGLMIALAFAGVTSLQDFNVMKSISKAMPLMVGLMKQKKQFCELRDFILRHVFNEHPDLQLAQAMKSSEDRLMQLTSMQLQAYLTDPGLLADLKKLVDEATDLLKTANRVESVEVEYKQLQSQIARSTSKLQTVSEGALKGGTRVVPTCVIFTGETGDGKSFAAADIASGIAKSKSYTRGTYSWTITPYWPEYFGQEIALNDECLGTPEECTEFSNRIKQCCSLNPLAIPGAFVKNQMCNFKLMINCTNVMPATLASALGAGSVARAVLERAIVYRTKYMFEEDAMKPRGEKRRCPNYSHINYVKQRYDVPSGNLVDCNGPPLLHDQVTRDIMADMQRKQVEFHSLQARSESLGDHLALSFLGPPQKGKSTTMNDIAARMSALVKLPVFAFSSCNRETMAGVRGRQAIVTFDDVIANDGTVCDAEHEDAVKACIDSLAQGSIVLHASNLPLRTSFRGYVLGYKTSPYSLDGLHRRLGYTGRVMTKSGLTNNEAGIMIECGDVYNYLGAPIASSEILHLLHTRYVQKRGMLDNPEPVVARAPIKLTDHDCSIKFTSLASFECAMSSKARCIPLITKDAAVHARRDNSIYIAQSLKIDQLDVSKIQNISASNATSMEELIRKFSMVFSGARYIPAVHLSIGTTSGQYRAPIIEVYEPVNAASSFRLTRHESTGEQFVQYSLDGRTHSLSFPSARTVYCRGLHSDVLPISVYQEFVEFCDNDATMRTALQSIAEEERLMKAQAASDLRVAHLLSTLAPYAKIFLGTTAFCVCLSLMVRQIVKMYAPTAASLEPFIQCTTCKTNPRSCHSKRDHLAAALIAYKVANHEAISKRGHRRMVDRSGEAVYSDEEIFNDIEYIKQHRRDNNITLQDQQYIYAISEGFTIDKFMQQRQESIHGLQARVVDRVRPEKALISKVSANTIQVFDTVEGAPGQMRQYGLGVRGRIFVTAAHGFYGYNTGDTSPIAGTDPKLVAVRDSRSQVEKFFLARCVAHIPANDLAFYEIEDKVFPEFANIVPRFCPGGSRPNGATTYLVNCDERHATLTNGGHSTYLTERTTTIGSCTYESSGVVVYGGVDRRSDPGDCGKGYVSVHPTIGPFVAGIHVAGFHVQQKSAAARESEREEGYFACIFFEDLMGLFAGNEGGLIHNYDVRSKSGSVFTTKTAVHDSYADVLTGAVTRHKTFSTCVPALGEKVHVVGSVQPPTPMTNPYLVLPGYASNILTLAGDEPKIPVNLCPETWPAEESANHVRDATGVIRPMLTTASKFAQPSPPVTCRDSLEACQRLLMSYQERRLRGFRVLTDAEVLNGTCTRQTPSYDALFGRIESVPLDTSCGPVLQRLTGRTQKGSFLDRVGDSLKLSGSADGLRLKDIYQFYMQHLKSQSRAIPFSCARLIPKMEKISQSKLFQPRGIFVRDTHAYMAERKVLGAYQALNKCRSRNCMVGMDMLRDFHRIGRTIAHYDAYYDMDYASWDTSVPAELANMVTESICHAMRVHSVAEADVRAAKKLLDLVTSGYVLLEDALTYFERGLQSGSNLTAPFNSDINLAAVMHTYIKYCEQEEITPSLEHFEDNCMSFFYGDDGLVAVRGDLKAMGLSFHADCVKRHFNMTVTSGNKADNIQANRKITELSFLSRTFVEFKVPRLARAPAAIIMGKLKKKTIASMVLYSKDVDVDTLALVLNKAMMEAAVHGPTYFSTIKQCVNRVANEHPNSRLGSLISSAQHADWMNAMFDVIQDRIEGHEGTVMNTVLAEPESIMNPVSEVFIRYQAGEFKNLKLQEDVEKKRYVVSANLNPCGTYVSGAADGESMRANKIKACQRFVAHLPHNGVPVVLATNESGYKINPARAKNEMMPAAPPTVAAASATTTGGAIGTPPDQVKAQSSHAAVDPMTAPVAVLTESSIAAPVVHDLVQAPIPDFAFMTGRDWSVIEQLFGAPVERQVITVTDATAKGTVIARLSACPKGLSDRHDQHRREHEYETWNMRYLLMNVGGPGYTGNYGVCAVTDVNRSGYSINELSALSMELYSYEKTNSTPINCRDYRNVDFNRETSKVYPTEPGFVVVAWDPLSPTNRVGGEAALNLTVSAMWTHETKFWGPRLEVIYPSASAARAATENIRFQGEETLSIAIADNSVAQLRRVPTAKYPRVYPFFGDGSIATMGSNVINTRSVPTVLKLRYATTAKKGCSGVQLCATGSLPKSIYERVVELDGGADTIEAFIDRLLSSPPTGVLLSPIEATNAYKMLVNYSDYDRINHFSEIQGVVNHYVCATTIVAMRTLTTIGYLYVVSPCDSTGFVFTASTDGFKDRDNAVVVQRPCSIMFAGCNLDKGTFCNTAETLVPPYDGSMRNYVGGSYTVDVADGSGLRATPLASHLPPAAKQVDSLLGNRKVIRFNSGPVSCPNPSAIGFSRASKFELDLVTLCEKVLDTATVSAAAVRVDVQQGSTNAMKLLYLPGVGFVCNSTSSNVQITDVSSHSLSVTRVEPIFSVVDVEPLSTAGFKSYVQSSRSYRINPYLARQEMLAAGILGGAASGAASAITQNRQWKHEQAQLAAQHNNNLQMLGMTNEAKQALLAQKGRLDSQLDQQKFDNSRSLSAYSGQSASSLAREQAPTQPSTNTSSPAATAGPRATPLPAQPLAIGGATEAHTVA